MARNRTGMGIGVHTYQRSLLVDNVFEKFMVIRMLCVSVDVTVPKYYCGLKMVHIHQKTKAYISWWNGKDPLRCFGVPLCIIVSEADGRNGTSGWMQSHTNTQPRCPVDTNTPERDKKKPTCIRPQKRPTSFPTRSVQNRHFALGRLRGEQGGSAPGR